MTFTVALQRLSSTAVVLTLGCTTVATPSDPLSSLGRSRDYAIEVCQPAGAVAYLKNLLCMDGSQPSFRRLWNAGPRSLVSKEHFDSLGNDVFRRMLEIDFMASGEPDLHIVDVFETTCNGEVQQLLFDTYHCRLPQTTSAPSGFKLQSQPTPGKR